MEDGSRRVRRHRQSLNKHRQSHSDAPYTIVIVGCVRSEYFDKKLIIIPLTHPTVGY